MTLAITHDIIDGLVEYFARLEIDEDFYQRMVNEIEAKTGNNNVQSIINN